MSLYEGLRVEVCPFPAAPEYAAYDGCRAVVLGTRGHAGDRKAELRVEGGARDGEEETVPVGALKVLP